MSCVQSISDIERNAFELLDTLLESGIARELAIKLIKGGKVFYPIQYEDHLAFVPSKFIGYRNNSVHDHERLKHQEGRDGRETNEIIRKILGTAARDDYLEVQLTQYCRSIGTELEKHKHRFWRIEGAKRFTAPAKSAINDVAAQDVTNPDPEYRKRMAGTYLRIQAVRNTVLQRAGGKCEFCKKRGFETRSGTRFLETHHIISLSEEGPDKPDNVIALCPNDHRRAHFGEDWKALQKQFKAILKAYKI